MSNLGIPNTSASQFFITLAPVGQAIDKGLGSIACDVYIRSMFPFRH
jgi:cyclophilin family peptidyl-prolyl cis-trans isomerase